MKKSILTFDEKTFYLNGEPFRVVAGDIHYFRIHESQWGQRLDLAADFGLNVIQTYVPWNAHEEKPGAFCFEGRLDLSAFLAACAERGLYVFLRPSPYICSEWDLGGLPAWLLRDRDTVLRSHDRAYMDAVRRYYEKLIPQFLPYLSTNGGPILAVAVENEYGSYGQDPAYIDALADLLVRGGVDVPLYTTDGDLPRMINYGRHGEDFFGVNYRATRGTSDHAAMMSEKMGENCPFFVGEFWAGRSMHFGEPFAHRDPRETSDGFREALEKGGHVCFYMFSGGTNFGFMGGANYGGSYSPRPGTPAPRYIPHTTSYDVDALLGEDGTPREKYYLCRDELDAYLGRPARPHILPAHPTQACTVRLTEKAPLFANLDALTGLYSEGVLPRPMEDYGQNYGLILYSQDLIPIPDDRFPLYPENLRDRATIYADGAWFATYMRDRGVQTDAPTEGTRAVWETNGRPVCFDVLVENLGRINYGHDLTEERKGITGLFTGGAKLYGCRTRTLPLDDLSRLRYEENKEETFEAKRPVFLRGTFTATPGVDSYVSVAGLGHGYVWVNGFNLGRYDSAGPQMTLYCPGALLQAENTVEILDILPTAYVEKAELLSHEVLEGMAKDLA